MHELYCPSCNTPSPYQFGDYLLMCPFCSGTFHFNEKTGHKEPFGDHFIIPNTLDSSSVKDMVIEWLKRLHHRPGMVAKEFFITDIQGFSMPLWIVSLECHTTWKGLVQKKHVGALAQSGNEFLLETGQFRRSYRWSILGRTNICESWGMSRLHQPVESVEVDWDGFPLDSTLSRGRLVAAGDDTKVSSAYDVRKFFEFKYANGLPILGVQVPESEALRRAKEHVHYYHRQLARNNVSHLLDYRSELEIAGVQLIHTPFWRATYVYRPKTVLRHFLKPSDKHLLLDGFGKGVLMGETAIKHRDKVMVNAFIAAACAVFFFVLAILWHPSFYLVAGFGFVIALISFMMAMRNQAEKKTKQLQSVSDSFSRSDGDFEGDASPA